MHQWDIEVQGLACHQPIKALYTVQDHQGFVPQHLGEVFTASYSMPGRPHHLATRELEGGEGYLNGKIITYYIGGYINSLSCLLSTLKKYHTQNWFFLYNFFYKGTNIHFKYNSIFGMLE